MCQKNNTLLDPKMSPYAWIGSDLNESKIDLSVDVKLPLNNGVLKELLLLLKACTKHNFKSALAVLGGFIVNFHYEAIIKKYSMCPIVVCAGPSESTIYQQCSAYRVARLTMSREPIPIL